MAWGSGTRSVASVVLIANGICFAVMTVLFVTLGSAADYGNFGRWLLLVLTLICWVFQYCMISIRHSYHSFCRIVLLELGKRESNIVF